MEQGRKEERATCRAVLTFPCSISRQGGASAAGPARIPPWFLEPAALMTDSNLPRAVPETDPADTAPRMPERRKGIRAYDDEARLAGLTPEQQDTVHTMETFHWRLEFVRRPLFRFPIPVMFNQAGDRFVVIRDDGTIDEEPDLKLRD